MNILDPDTAELWVASRVFDRTQSVGDRLGRNEKTKVGRGVWIHRLPCDNDSHLFQQKLLLKLL